MNIFVVDECPVLSAQMLCDKHIVKMPLETAQMLCSVWHRHNVGDKVPYKAVHQKHPATLWAGDSMDNYDWLWQHGMELCFEYTRRYNKIHKCQQVIMDLEVYQVPFVFTIRDYGTPHPQCMPDEYKSTKLRIHSNTVKAYRTYYVNAKKSIAKWEKSRPMPQWFTKESYVL
ncbi:MAG: hypothetical protein CMC70_11225 [Flavobacteriaceae bacterium]|nr:hypothetical protein [Flavobacteriaceae bacterium]|tara:strand:- start:1366 stop:1881 length:516 start_codon:yes stop_codon:yes gene_type:complete